MKTVLLAIPLLTAGVLTAGCSSSSSSTTTASTATAGSSASSSATAAPSASGGSAASPSSAASSAAAAGSASPGLAACTSADLKVSLGGGAGAGMSQNHVGLQLRNIGSSTCTLYGYPGVSWVAGADGHQVGAAAVRQPDSAGSAEKTVTLAPGALASAPMDIVDSGVLSRSECKPVPVRGLRIYPPGQKAALFLPLTSAGGYGECSAHTRQALLSIGYLQAGVQPGGGDAG